jgi:PhoPQ-activated pathogenicity-related protein
MKERFYYILFVYQWINGKKTTIKCLNLVERLTEEAMFEKLDKLTNVIDYYQNFPYVKFLIDNSIVVINKADGPIKIEMDKKHKHG